MVWPVVLLMVFFMNLVGDTSNKNTGPSPVLEHSSTGRLQCRHLQVDSQRVGLGTVATITPEHGQNPCPMDPHTEPEVIGDLDYVGLEGPTYLLRFGGSGSIGLHNGSF